MEIIRCDYLISPHKKRSILLQRENTSKLADFSDFSLLWREFLPWKSGLSYFLNP